MVVVGVLKERVAIQITNQTTNGPSLVIKEVGEILEDEVEEVINQKVQTKKIRVQKDQVIQIFCML